MTIAETKITDNQSTARGHHHFDGSFIPSISSACVDALQKLKEALVKISNLYGDQNIKETKVIGETGKASASFLAKAGREAYRSAFNSAIGGIVSGGIGMASGMAQLANFGINSSKIDATQGEINNLNQCKQEAMTNVELNDRGQEMNNLGNRPENEENPLKSLQKDIDEDKFKSLTQDDRDNYGNATPQERKDFEKSVNDAIKRKQEKMNGLRRDAAEKSQGIGLSLRGASTIAQSSGEIAGAPHRKKEQEDRAAQSSLETAKQLAQSSIDQAQKKSSENYSSAIEVINDMKAISRSNGMN